MASKTIHAKLPPPSRRRTIRLRAGKSLHEVAERVGVSDEAVRLWETGKNTPSQGNRTRYLKVLNQLARAR